MKYKIYLYIIIGITQLVPAYSQLSKEDDDPTVTQKGQWPSYRGLYGNGYMDNAGLPDTFDLRSGLNVQWNIPIPGLGQSSPVIWDDRVYISTAISDADSSGYQTGMFGDIAPVQDSSEHRWMVYAIDRRSGQIIWEQEACRGVPAVRRHPKSSHASASLATDGKHVVAFFGSEGLYCFDREGHLRWKRDFGYINSSWHVVESAEWEFSSSPLIHGDKVIIQADALNTAFVAVLDLATGKTIWRRDRDEIPGWCSPNIYFNGDKARVVVNGYKHRGAYDLESGEEIWRMAGGGDIPVPMPLVWEDLIFFNSAHGRHRPLMAVRAGSEGEIPYPEKDNEPDQRLAWFYDREGAYMTTALVYEDLLYMLRWNGSMSCYDARTGSKIYDQTVHPGSFIASPVAADGRIYLLSEEGDLYVVKSGSDYALLRTIPLGESSLVTPAIGKGQLILRTSGRLMGIGKTD